MVQPVPREKQGYVDHCPLRIKALAAESIEVVFGEQAADLDRFDVLYDCATNSGGGEESIEVVFGEQAADLDRFDVLYDCATNSGGGEDYQVSQAHTAQTR